MRPSTARARPGGKEKFFRGDKGGKREREERKGREKGKGKGEREKRRERRFNVGLQHIWLWLIRGHYYLQIQAASGVSSAGIYCFPPSSYLSIIVHDCETARHRLQVDST